MKCSKCTGPLSQTDGGVIRCLDCKSLDNINLKNIKTELDEAEALFDSGQHYLQLGNNKDALTDLKRCLNIRQKWLFKYHDDLAATFNTLAIVSITMGKSLDAISYLEQSISIIDEKFGTESFEVADQLDNITDICIKYLQQEIHHRTTKFW